MKKSIIIYREQHLKDRTLGALTCWRDDVDELELVTLELPWRNNEIGKSCLPADIYTVKKRWTKKYGWHLIVIGTGKRTYILLHSGVYPRHTLGCILVGLYLADFDGDKVMDIAEGKKAIKRLVEWVGDAEVELEII